MQSILHELRLKGRGLYWVNLTMRAVRDDSGNVRHLDGFIEDITAQRNAEEALEKAHQHLQIQFAKRSADLQHRTQHLEEAHTALKVLLRQNEDDKRELEAILRSMKNLLRICFQGLREDPLSPHQSRCLSTLEAHIDGITFPFVWDSSRGPPELTPAELQVVNLIREGRTTKQMAELLHVSENTIVFHRKNLRSKLGLKGKHANLAAYLQSLR